MNKQVFIDEDLENLKEKLKDKDWEWTMMPHHAEALLARLEAAEAVASWAHTNRFELEDFTLQKLLGRWVIAKGR